jgi:hypothetical protein
MYTIHSVASATSDGATMIQAIVDPVEYVQRFCEEIGAPTVVRDEVAGETPFEKRRGKRRLFLRMYRYKGRPFVIRAYEGILGRPPRPDEIQSAQSAFFERKQSRTFMMLALRFGEEGRLASSCNIVGLSALRVFWNITHRRKRRRLFWRMYQYRGRPFVIRAYERILGRPPQPEEIQTAQSAFFDRQHSRTSMMLALRFGEEGRFVTSCNIVGLSALRVFWNVTHRRNRRIAPLAGER